MKRRRVTALTRTGTRAQRLRWLGLVAITWFVWLWSPSAPSTGCPLAGGVATAVAHPMGFATGDLYLREGASGRLSIELEVVLDVPEGELVAAVDSGAAEHRRARLLTRVGDNLHLLQENRRLSKRVRILGLGRGSAAVDVLRVRAEASDTKLPLRVQVGAQIDDLVLKVHRQPGSTVEDVWIASDSQSGPIPFESAALPSTPHPAFETTAASAPDAVTSPGPPASMPRGLPFWQSVRRGFVHILPLGFDHVVFILGLFFLASSLRLLIIELSLFTLAHSITLALGALRLIEIPPSIAEPLIALSILLIGLEPRWTAWLNTSSKQLPWAISVFHLRAVVVFGFGLLHGLGFASVLGRLGTSGTDFARTLLGFNLGVELGQLAVVAGALIVFGPFRKHPWYRSRVVPVACTSVAVLGGLWLLERLLA